jgi:hypothetical protein
MLDGLLALDGIANVIELLVVDQYLQAEALGEAFDERFAKARRGRLLVTPA